MKDKTFPQILLYSYDFWKYKRSYRSIYSLPLTTNAPSIFELFYLVVNALMNNSSRQKTLREIYVLLLLQTVLQSLFIDRLCLTNFVHALCNSQVLEPPFKQIIYSSEGPSTIGSFFGKHAAEGHHFHFSLGKWLLCICIAH